MGKTIGIKANKMPKTLYLTLHLNPSNKSLIIYGEVWFISF
jgi:hypothetical protein